METASSTLASEQKGDRGTLAIRSDRQSARCHRGSKSAVSIARSPPASRSAAHETELRCRHRRVAAFRELQHEQGRTSHHMAAVDQTRREIFGANMRAQDADASAHAIRPRVQRVRRGPDALRIEMTETRRFGLGLPEQDRRSAGRVDASCPSDAQRAGNATALLWPDPRPPDHVRPERGFGLHHCSKFLR